MRKSLALLTVVALLGGCLIIYESSKPRTANISSNLKTADVVGVWVNHRDREIHQQITLTKSHRWHENQHHQKNIYHGTWKITGKHEIMLAPYQEKIRFSHDKQTMTVVNYDHVLTRNHH